MDEHHSWYNGSVWHKNWPHQVCVGQWPKFYGPVILLHILKTIWWRIVVLGTMDRCDSKIVLIKYMSQLMRLWYLSHRRSAKAQARTISYVQSRQSLCCSHAWSVEVDEGSDQKSDIKPHWMAAHARLKNEFMKDEKSHNLIMAHTWVSDLYFMVHWFCLISSS